MLEYLHLEAGGCGKPAFRFVETPDFEGRVSSAIARDLDGNKPDKGSPIVCGSCGGRNFDTVLHSAHLREMAAQ